MKTIFTICIALIVNISCNQENKLKVVLSKFPNGNIQELMYYNLPITKDSIAFSEIYFDNGQIAAKGSCINGKKNGEWTKYRKNGMIECKTNYIEDVENGLLVCYEEDGSWRKMQIINGCKQGTTTEYRVNPPNPNLWVHGQYNNCKEIGLWLWMDSKNRILQKLFYNNGVPDKYYEMLDTTGNLIQKAILTKGNIDTLYSYNSGELINTIAYKNKVEFHLKKKKTKQIF